MSRKKENLIKLRQRIKHQGGICVWCGETNRKLLTVDHIIPISWNRYNKTEENSDRSENLQILCGKCNIIKGDKSGKPYNFEELRYEK